jgi:hypothetical protein
MEVHSPLSSFVPLRALPRAPSNLFDFCAFVFEKIPPDYAIVLSVEEKAKSGAGSHPAGPAMNSSAQLHTTTSAVP